MIEISQEQLELLHNIELELLEEVDRICKDNGIRYTIIGGTLLGAVRHGGFIPWDDDADVAMLRPEYEKFCSVVEKELDRQRFYFQNMDITPGYRWGYAKLRRKNTLFLRNQQEHMPYEQGVFLDIFPIDGTPDNRFLRAIHDFRCFCVRKTLWSAVARYSEPNRLKRFVFRILSRIPEKRVKKAYRNLILKHHANETKVVRTLTFPAPSKLRGYYRRWFAETAPIWFEGKWFDGVRDYKGWLSYEFGNYMELPPKSKQKTHPVSQIKLINVREE